MIRVASLCVSQLPLPPEQRRLLTEASKLLDAGVLGSPWASVGSCREETGPDII